MKKHLFDRIPFTKIAIMLAIAATLGIGSCGVGAALSGVRASDGLIVKLVEFFLIVGASGFWLSVLCLILLSILWIVLYIAKEIASRN